MVRTPESVKANYKRLRDAGLSREEASRLRYASPEKIEQAIKTHKAPAKDTRKQTRLKVTVKEKEYHHSSLRIVEVKSLDDPVFIEKIRDSHRKLKKQGYIYLSVWIEFRFENFGSEFKASIMFDISKDGNRIETYIEKALDMLERFFESYSYIDDDDFKDAKTYFYYWKPKKKSKSKKSSKK